MIVFLTSSPTGPLDGARKVDGFDKKNKFYENLKKYCPEVKEHVTDRMASSETPFAIA